MEKFIGQEIEDLHERELFIKDNAEGVEKMGYSKPLPSPEANDIVHTSRDGIINDQLSKIQEELPGLLVIEK